jgi:hypothetical protein
MDVALDDSELKDHGQKTGIIGDMHPLEIYNIYDIIL